MGEPGTRDTCTYKQAQDPRAWRSSHGKEEVGSLENPSLNTRSDFVVPAGTGHGLGLQLRMAERTAAVRTLGRRQQDGAPAAWDRRRLVRWDSRAKTAWHYNDAPEKVILEEQGSPSLSSVARG